MSYATAAVGDFYFRAGLGPDRATGATFMDLDCSSASPAALYGCGQGGDGAPYRSTGDFGQGVAFELGFGHVTTPTLRLEWLVEYRPGLIFDGQTNFLDPGRQQSVTAESSVLSGMLAAHVDLPALGTPEFVPFVGAGVGVARTRIGEMRMTFPRTMTVVPGAARTGSAWMISFGAATRLTERTTLELAWRYADLGEVRTGQGEGQVVWRDGSHKPRILDLAATRARFRSHGLRLSLRYLF